MRCIAYTAAGLLCASTAFHASAQTIEEKPPFVVGPPAVIDGSGNPVMAAGRIVTSQSSSPLPKDSVIVSRPASARAG